MKTISLGLYSALGRGKWAEIKFVPLHGDLRVTLENYDEEYKHIGVSSGPESLTTIVKEVSECPVVRPDHRTVLDMTVATAFPGRTIIHSKIEFDITFRKDSDKHIIKYVFECMLSHE